MYEPKLFQGNKYFLNSVLDLRKIFPYEDFTFSISYTYAIVKKVLFLRQSSLNKKKVFL